MWDWKVMGEKKTQSGTNSRLGFLIVRLEWLRDAAKLYVKYCLPLYSASTCRTRVQSLACFSDFLAEVKPQATAKDITRRLLLDYLNYLQKRVRTGCAKNNVLNLRNFLEMSHREAWLPVGPERLIYDEEEPQPPKLERRGSQAGQLRSQEQPSCLRSRHPRRGRQAVRLPGAPVPSPRWNPHGESRSSSPHHPALPRP